MRSPPQLRGRRRWSTEVARASRGQVLGTSSRGPGSAPRPPRRPCPARSATGSVSDPRSLRPLTCSADPGRRGRGRAEPAPPAGARWPCRYGSPSSAAAVVQSASARWPARTGSGPVVGRLALGRRRPIVGAAAALARPRPRARPARRAACAAVRKPSRSPRPSASAASTRRSVIALGLRDHGVEAAVAGPPSSRRCRPAPAISETGKHHVGPLGDQRRPGLQADHEVDRLQPLQRGLRDRAKSLGSTPATTRAASSSSAAESNISSASRPSRPAAIRPPGGLRCRPGRPDRRPDGRRAAGWAGSRPRPRPGHRPGAAPRPAGHRCARPAAGTALSVPDRPRGPLADQDDRVRRIQRRASARSCVQRRRLRARAARRSVWRRSCGRRCSGTGARVQRGQTPLADGLAQPQEDRAGLLLRLEADQQHRAGGLQVGVGHAAAPVPATAWARKSASSSRVRPGPEVDVVGAEHGAGELGVRVRVLQGQPAAGQHADARTGSRPALAGPRTRRRRSPPARTPAGARCCPSGSVSRTSGRVSRSSAAAVREGEPVLVGDPLLVDLGVVAGQPAHHLAAPVVDPDGRPAGVVLGDATGCETRSNGRERNRYAALVSAPTGQIWMVLPEK